MHNLNFNNFSSPPPHFYSFEIVSESSRLKTLNPKTKQPGLTKKIILTHLVPEAGNDDGDVTDATDDHEEDIGDSKAVVAQSGHSERFPLYF